MVVLLIVRLASGTIRTAQYSNKKTKINTTKVCGYNDLCVFFAHKSTSSLEKDYIYKFIYIYI